MSWLKTLKQMRTSPKRGRLASRRQQAARRLALEILEDRTLLSITTQGIPDWVHGFMGPFVITGGQVQNITPGFGSVVDNNPVIGAIQAIAPHPTNADILYVAAVNGGIFRTTQARVGGDWTALTQMYPSLSMGDLAFSPLDTNVLYAGTARLSSGFNDGGPLNGLLKTTDGGNTWSMLGQTTFNGQSIIRVRPTSLTVTGGQVVLVATSNPAGGGSVFRSIDGGVNWTTISGTGNLPIGAPTDLVGDPTNINRFYAAIPSTGPGVFRSDDGGVNWVPANLPTGWSGSRIRLAVGREGVVYAATMGSQLSNVFRSTNQGGAWTSMGVPSPTIHPGNQAGNNFSIAANPGDTNNVFIGGDRQAGPNDGVPFANGCTGYTGNHFRGIFGTPTTWDSLDCNGARLPWVSGGPDVPTSPHADSRAMAFDADGSLLEADDGGIYRLLNPTGAANFRRWVSSFSGNFGLGNATEFYSIAYDSLSRTFFGGAQDVGSPQQIQSGNDFRWFEFPADVGDGAVVAADNISQAGRSIRYTSNQNFGNFRRRTFDNTGTLVSDSLIALTVAGTGTPASNLFQVEANVPAHTCQPGETPPPGQALCTSTVQSIQPYVLNHVDPRQMIIGTSYLYESTDSGDTVTSVGGLTNLGGGNWRPNNPVGTVNPNTCDPQFPTICRQTSNPIDYGGFMNGVANTQVLWIGAGGQLRLRTSGTGLPTVVAAYPGGPVVAVRMDPADWRAAYVLDSTSRVWRTTDQGTNWTELTGNLCNLARDLNSPNQPMDLRTFEVVRSGTNLAVLVGGLGGVYRAANPGANPGPCSASSTGTWSRLGIGGTARVVTDLHYNAAAYLLFAAGLGGYVATIPSAVLTGHLFDTSTLTVNAVADERVRLARVPNHPNWLTVFENGVPSPWVGTTTDVEGEAAAIQQIIVNAPAGSVTVDIDDTFAGVALTLNLFGAGTHTINISPTARNLNTIQGNISLNLGGGENFLTVNDQAAVGSPLVYTTTRATFLSRTLGPASSGLINLVSSSLVNTTINAGSNSTVGLQEMLAFGPMTINLGSGTNSVKIGQVNQDLDLIRHNLIVNGAGVTTLDIDDRASASGRGFEIRPDRVIYGLVVFGPINVTYSNVRNLTVHASMGDNTVRVLGTSPGTMTSFDPGNGRNTVDVQDGTLNGIGGGGASPGTGFGRYTVAAPATLNFIAGTFALNADSSITGAGTVVFSGSSSLTLAGTYNVSGPTRIASPSTVNYNAAATTAQLFLTGGVLGGTGDLTVTDTLTWTDGTMQGSGRTLANGRLEISGAARKTLDTRRLENAGQGVWSDAGDILVANGGIFTNSPTGVFDVRSDSRLRQGNGARGQFTNAGTFRKSAGSQATTVEVNFNNSGTVDVQAGTLSLLGDGNDSGAFTVAAGTTLGFDGGNPTLTAGSMVTTSGALRFGNAITTVNGSIAAATGSTIAFEAGTHIFSAGSSLAGTTTVRFASPTNATFGGTFNVVGLTRAAGGQANFNSSGTTTQLALEGGFIGGSADLTVSDATTWIAAGYNGNGHLRANGGIAITGPAPKQVANGTLDNSGLATWSDSGPLQIFQGGTWNNLPGSTLEARNDAAMQGLTGQLGRFLNAGLFRKTPSSGTTQVSVAVTNSGTIHVQTGTVLLDGPLTNLSGTTLTGGTFQVQTTLQIPGADIHTNAAILILDGVSSNISRDGQRTDALANLTANTADGRITIRNGRALTTGGSFDNAGLFTMEDTGILTLQGNWNNSGQFQWYGSGNVGSSMVTRFDNRAGATFDIRGDAQFRNNSNFFNAGAVRKSAGTGVSTFERTGFNNGGMVEVQAGTLRLAGGGASTGRFTVQAGTTLEFAGGTHLLAAASAVDGAGQVAFSAPPGGGSTSIVQGSYTVTGSTRVVSGFNLATFSVSFLSATPITTGDLTLIGGPAYFGTDATATSLTLQQGGPTSPSTNLDGPGTVTVSGLITWTGGTMNGTGRTIALGGIVISGPDEKGLVDRTLVNAGTATWTGATFRLFGGTLNNSAGAVFDVQTDAPISTSGNAGVINNAGTLRKSAGAGITAIDVVLNNSGAVEVQSGTLRLGRAGSTSSSTSSGGFTVQAGAILEFAGGTHRLTDSSFIAGGGRVRFNNATASLAGSYNLTGDTVIDAGTAEFVADASTGTLTQSGGTLTGAGTLTVTGQTTWTGGTMSGIGRTIALGGLQLGGDSKSLQNRSFDNAGPAVWTGGDIFASAGTFNNLAGADFDIRSDVRFLGNFVGDSVFNNAGTLHKSASNGISEISLVLNNRGAVEVQSGTLRLSSGGDSTGSFTIDAGATLDFAGADHLLEESAVLTDNGRLTVTRGTLYYAGDFTLTNGAALLVDRLGTLTIAGGFMQSGGSTILSGGTLAVGSGIFLRGGTLSGAGQIIGDVFNSASIMVGDATTAGTLNINGNYTQTADGLLMLKLGGTAAGRFDQLVVSGSAALAGTLRVTLFAGYMPASGDSLRVLTAGTRTGTFDTLDGDGPLFNPLYDGTGLTLRRP